MLHSLVNQYMKQPEPLSLLTKITSDYDIDNTELVDYISSTSKRRQFDMYMKLSNIIDFEKQSFSNNLIKKGIRELLEPFFRHSMEATIEYMSGMERTNDLIMVESLFSTFVSKATNVRNVTTHFIDTPVEVHPVKRGMSVYISKTLPTTNKLYVSWVNDFFQFSDPGSIIINIFIPISYINSLMIEVQAIHGKNIIHNEIPLLQFRTHCKDSFERDLVHAFLHSIYTDTVRLKSISDMFQVYNIGKDEYSVLKRNDVKLSIFVKKYSQSLDKQYKTNENENVHIIKDALDLFLFSRITTKSINPDDFYGLFSHIPNLEVCDVLDKLKFDKRFTMSQFHNDMEMLKYLSLSKDTPAILAYALRIERSFMHLLYNNYIVSNGKYHSIINTYIQRVKQFIPLIESLKHENTQYSFAISSVIANIRFYCDKVFPVISSPAIFTSNIVSTLNDVMQFYFDNMDSTIQSEVKLNEY